MMNLIDVLRRWLEKPFVEENFPLVRFFLGAFGAWVLLGIVLRLWITGVYPSVVDPKAGLLDEAFWRALIETGNFGGLGKEELSTWPHRVVGLFTALGGGLILLFGVAGLSAKLTLKLFNRQSGLGELNLKGHHLVLGFSEQTIEVIEELIEANRHKKGGEILVLCELNPAEALERLKEGIADFQNSRIYCRTGNISSPFTLQRVGVNQARSVVLINPVQPWESDERKHEGDTAMQMAVMAIHTSCPLYPPPVVVRMHFKRNLQIAQTILEGRVFAAQENLMMAKIIAQTARNPDVGRVYSNLAGFKGHEFYFLEMPTQLVGLTFGEAAVYFTEAMPFGVRFTDGSIELNPPAFQVLCQGEDLIVLALDVTHLRCLDSPCIVPRALEASGKRHRAKREAYLVYGWNRKTGAVIEELASYLPKGSVVNVVVPEIGDGVRRRFKQVVQNCRHLELRLGQVDPGSDLFPAKLAPEGYRAVLLQSPQSGGAEAMDRMTFSILLKFHTYFKERESNSGEGRRTKLLAEIQRTNNGRLMQATGLDSFLISSQVLSKIMAQVAEEPSVLGVYDDLFQAEGNEIYLKDLSLYLAELSVEVHFADLVLAAQQRGEVCIGLKLKRLDDNLADGFGLVMLPSKSQSFWVTKGDQLIVLSPDET